MRNFSSLLALVVLTASMNAKAVTKSVDLLDHQLRLRGAETINLKRMMRQTTFSRGQIAGWQLKSVELDAKSKDGNADVTLQVGYRETSPKQILGNPDEFRTNSGFHSIYLSSPSFADNKSKWKLHFTGKVLVNDIDLKLEKDLNYDYKNVSGLRFKSVATFKADKLVGDTKTIHVGGFLKGIKLKAHKNKVSINGIKIFFEDGEVVNVSERNGSLKKGREKGLKIASFLDKPISKIKVSATSYKLFGSRAKVEVLLAR